MLVFLQSVNSEESFGNLSSFALIQAYTTSSSDDYGVLSLKNFFALSSILGNQVGDLSSLSSIGLGSVLSSYDTGTELFRFFTGLDAISSAQGFGIGSTMSSTGLSSISSGQFGISSTMSFTGLSSISSGQGLGIGSTMSSTGLSSISSGQFGISSTISSTFLTSVDTSYGSGTELVRFFTGLDAISSGQGLGIGSTMSSTGLSSISSGQFGISSTISSTFLTSVDTSYGSGSPIASLLFNLTSISSLYSSGAFSFEYYLRLSSLSTSEVLGNSKFHANIFLGTISSEESLDKIIVDYFYFSQAISWNVDAEFVLTSNITWNVGQGIRRWYRVQGCCTGTLSSQSGGSGEGPPVGCDVLKFSQDDPKCKGQQLFIQNILARSVSDVCNQLNEYNLKWRVCSIKVYSNPAGPVVDECNTLTEVPFASYPECLEVSINTDALVKIKLETFAYEVFKYTGLGGVVASGGSVSSGGTSYPSFYYQGSGGPTISGSYSLLPSWSEDYTVSSTLDFYVDSLKTVTSIKDLSSTLKGITESIRTSCGNCTSIPSVIYSYDNISRSYVISRFFGKNSISFPSYIPIYYSKLIRGWTGNYQVSGDGDLGKESWNFILTWNCLSQKAEEDSDPYWKYTMLVKRSIPSVNLYSETKVSVVFPPEELCRLINNLFVDFSFSLNIKTLYVDNSFVNVTDYVILYDKIGIFKDADWTADPWFTVKFSRLVSTSRLQILNLSPIIP